MNALHRPLLSFLSIRCRRNQHQQHQHQHRRRRCPWKSTRSLNGAVRGRTQRCLCAARLVHPGCNGDTLRSDCAGRICLQNRAGSTSSLSETAKAAVRGIERRCVREDPLMIKPVATFATLLMVLMPAAATPMPAVKSAQCAPGHMVSGGFCAPLFRMPPAAVPKVMHCPNRLMQRGSSSCLEMRRR